MLRLSVKGDNFDPIIAMLDRMARPDLTPLAADLRQVMLDDNRDGLLAGTNANGDRAADLEESTIRRGRPGDGPPRVPRGPGSRMIADYDVDVQQAPDRLLLIGSWQSTPFVHFHDSGTRHMVAREMVGIRPAGQARIAEALDAFVGELIGGF